MKEKLHEIIFEADTKAGKLFDEILIVLILCSVIVVMFDSTKSIAEKYGYLLKTLEWFFTILFTIEYFLRIYSIKLPTKYIFSFFGIVDLLAIIPTYISFFFPSTRYLSVIRILRVLRIFRILKFVRYVSEAKTLAKALKASRRKIIIFVFVVLTIVGGN